MDPKANPIPKPGRRDVYCSCYNDCLDFAVERLWQSWNCSECPNRLTKQSTTECEYAFDDTYSYYDLPRNVARQIEKDLFD